MSGYHSPGKRKREMEQQRKKQDKEQARMDKRARGPKELSVVSASDVQGGMLSIDEVMRQMENPGQMQHSAPGIPVRCFVGSLSDRTTEADLRNAFGAFGQVLDAVIIVERGSGLSRGFGFVTMANRKDAPRAIETLNGSELQGSTIVVNVATERGR